MTDRELGEDVSKIITARVRLNPADKASAEARDLARCDEIGGLVYRHPVARAERPEQCGTTSRLLRVAEKGGAS